MFLDVSLPWNAGWMCLFWLRDVSDARVCRGGGHGGFLEGARLAGWASKQ